jgi:hypothetical protein
MDWCLEGNARYGRATSLRDFSNKISGIALRIASVFWLVIGWLLPVWMGASRQTDRVVQLVGLASVGIALAVSTWLTYKKWAEPRLQQRPSRPYRPAPREVIHISCRSNSAVSICSHTFQIAKEFAKSRKVAVRKSFIFDTHA